MKLQTKLFFSLIAIIGMVIVSIALLIFNGLNQAIYSEFTSRNEYLVHESAETIADYMLTGDIVSIHRWIEHITIENKEVDYVIIVDRNGEIFASSFDKFPTALKDVGHKNSITDGNHSELDLIILETEYGRINEISSPILSGSLGLLRIGFSENILKESVNSFLLKLVLVIGYVLIFTLIIAYFFAKKIVQPIKELNLALQEIKTGNYNVKIDKKTTDEFGEVIEAFNETITNVKITKDNIEKQIQDKTKELQTKIAELESFQKLTVDREIDMIDLKKRIKYLEERKDK